MSSICPCGLSWEIPFSFLKAGLWIVSGATIAGVLFVFFKKNKKRVFFKKTAKKTAKKTKPNFLVKNSSAPSAPKSGQKKPPAPSAPRSFPLVNGYPNGVFLFF